MYIIATRGNNIQSRSIRMTDEFTRKKIWKVNEVQDANETQEKKEKSKFKIKGKSLTSDTLILKMGGSEKKGIYI